MLIIYAPDVNLYISSGNRPCNVRNTMRIICAVSAIDQLSRNLYLYTWVLIDS